MSGAHSHHAPTVATINMAAIPAASQATVVKTATLAAVESQALPKMATISQSLVAQPLHITATTALSQQHVGGEPGVHTVVAAGTQHRVLTAAPVTATATATTLAPQATALVVSSAALAHAQAQAQAQGQAQPTITTVVQQQQHHQHQHQHHQSLQQSIVTAPVMVSAQALPSPSAMATVVTQTQVPQGVQLTAQQQQQLQKASPYAMRTRNPPKHS